MSGQLSYYSSLSAAESLDVSGFLGDAPGGSPIGTDISGGSGIGTYAYWYLGSNSTGTSLSGIVYQNLANLSDDGDYYLGAIPVAYFSTQADASADINFIGTSGYTVSAAGYSNWLILDAKTTGSSPQNVLYSSGNVLNPSGAYYVYPFDTVVDSIYYFSSLSAAEVLDASGFLGLSSPGIYEIGSELVVGSTGGYSNWYVGSNSTGTLPVSPLVTGGESLDPAGTYYLGGIPLAYFSNLSDALANVSALQLSESYTIDSSATGYPYWGIAANSTGSSLSSTIYEDGSVLNADGAYFLYPTFTASTAIVYFSSLSAADAFDLSGFLAISDASYTIGSGIDLGSTGGYSHWYISSNSQGSSLSGVPYTNGQTLSDDGFYVLGAIPVAYFNTQADALADVSALQLSESYTIATVSDYVSWRIAANSTGSSSQSVFYSTGNVLNADGAYFLYPGVPCFLEGTTVLCKVDDVETYVPVEQLKPGTLVKTSLNGYKPVVLLGRDSIQNPGHDERIEDRLYKLSPSKYPQLKDDLYITGGHSVLEFPMTEKQTQDTIKKLGDLYVTEGKYRLMACIDERAEPWTSEGRYTIWVFALEHTDDKKNYGVYVNGGLLVESCSVHFMKKNSNMTLVH
jgi:hypothetical protein